MSIKIIGLTNEFHVNSSTSGGSGGGSGGSSVGAVTTPGVSITNTEEYFVRFTTSSFDGYGEHINTDYKIYAQDDLNQSHIVYQSLANSAEKIQHTIDPSNWDGQGKTDFYVIARHRNEFAQVSKWSAVTNFTIDTPAVGSIAAFDYDAGDRVITADGYTGDGVHQSTDWKIVDRSDDSVIFQSLNDTTNLTTIDIADMSRTKESMARHCRIEVTFRNNFQDPMGGTETLDIFSHSMYSQSSGAVYDYTANPADYAGQIQVGWHIGGGIVVQTDGTTGLIMAPEDEPTTLQWKTADTDTPGTSSTTDGAANTAAMANTTHPAANACATKDLHGHTDWYLPAKDQLNTIYQYVKDDIADYGFTSSFYWSSTQSSTYNSWCQSFSDGFQYIYYHKTSQYQVRSVRNF